jgi:hypothetical protein
MSTLVVNNLVPATGNVQITGQDAYHRGNIVGTVSETGGVPTGAVLETGSNANGNFVKYADGTMIAIMRGGETRGATGALTTSITLPASFVNIALTGSSGSVTNQYFAAVCPVSTAPGAVLSHMVASYTATGLDVHIDRNTTTNTGFNVIVVGRWYA